MINNVFEYILCPAIRRNSPRKIKLNSSNSDMDFVEIGYKYQDIILRFSGELLSGPRSQGYLTSFGRFVDKYEAYKIAIFCGQIGIKDRDYLIETDIY